MSEAETKTTNGATVPGGAQNGSGAPLVKLSTSAMARAKRREAQALPTLETPEERSLDKEKMVSWIVDKSDPVHKKRQCHLFVLAHDHRISGMCTMTEELLAKGASPEEREAFARRIVDDFDEESRNTADQYPVFQRFVVSAAKGDDKEKGEDASLGQKSFNVSPRAETAASFHQANARHTSDVDVTSIVGQMQRSNEMHTRQLTETMAATQDRIIDWSTKVMETNERLEKDRFEMRVMMEDLLDRKLARETEAQRQAMLTEVYYKGFQLASSIGEQVIAKKFSLDGPMQQLATFMKTLEPMQFFSIFTMLSPEQHESFAPLAGKMIEAMPPEKRQVLVPLLKQYSDHVESQKAAAKEEARIKVTVSSPAASADEGGKK